MRSQDRALHNGASRGKNAELKNTKPNNRPDQANPTKPSGIDRISADLQLEHEFTQSSDRSQSVSDNFFLFWTKSSVLLSTHKHWGTLSPNMPNDAICYQSPNLNLGDVSQSHIA